MGLFVTTTGTDVPVRELGITIVHTTTDMDLGSHFSVEDLRAAASLTTAIVAGTLIWRKTAAGANEVAADYDPDFLAVESESTGGQLLYRSSTFADHLYDTSETRALANGTQTLTKTTPALQFYTGTTAGQIVKLPDATTCPLGRWFELANQGSQSISVRDNGDNVLFTLSQTSIAFIRLQTNGTSNGSWVCWQVFISSQASGILNYEMTSTTAFTTSSTTDVLITAFTVTPQAGRYAIWYDATMTQTNSTAQNWWSIYKGGVQIVGTERNQRAPAANTIMPQSTLGTVTVNGAEAVDVRVRCNTGSITINGRTMLLVRMGS